MKNRFEQCKEKALVRQIVSTRLQDHIESTNHQSIKLGSRDYVMLPGVNGYTEKILTKNLGRCPKLRPLTFHFFEKDSDIRKGWDFFLNKMEQKLTKKGFSITHNCLLKDDVIFNGGWIDLCASRTHKIVDFVRTILQHNLKSNGLMYFTWGETWAHIPVQDRSFITVEDLTQQMNEIDPTHVYSIDWQHSYGNEFSYGKQMITFGILKTLKNIVDFSDKPDIITNDMKNKTKTKTKRTVEDYIRLASRGFTNKQIAVYWKTSLRSIAAYQANVNR